MVTTPSLPLRIPVTLLPAVSDGNTVSSSIPVVLYSRAHLESVGWQWHVLETLFGLAVVVCAETPPKDKDKDDAGDVDLGDESGGGLLLRFGFVGTGMTPESVLENLLNKHDPLSVLPVRGSAARGTFWQTALHAPAANAGMLGRGDVGKEGVRGEKNDAGGRSLSSYPFRLGLHDASQDGGKRRGFATGWAGLSAIPFGSTVTYSGFASLLGYGQGGGQAAGNVTRSNPLSWFLPCHRVVRSDVGVFKYRWGGDLKQRLLAFEGDAVAPSKAAGGAGAIGAGGVAAKDRALSPDAPVLI